MKQWTRSIIGLGLGISLVAANAQILIGQTVGVTGSVAATVKEAAQGADLVFDRVNATGGIKGQKIELVILDDRFDVKQTVENTRILIEEKDVLALFMDRGTPNTEAMMPLLEKNRIALVGPSSGAKQLHTPVNPYIFNVRSPYQRETEKAVTHLATLGMTRIAVVHADDSFGQDALEGANKGFVKAKLQPLTVLKADRTKPNYSAIVPPLVASRAQAVVWIGSGTAVADGIVALRAAGSHAQVVTLSNNASGGFIKSLGDSSRGVIVTQVFPYERSFNYAFVREALALAKAKGMNDVSPAMLEGFASAKVMVEALRLASPKPTREKVLAALNKMNKFNLGGLTISYGPDHHSGLDFADLSIISDGRFKR
jgi:branched-chain amino acid transport system substrate-binding protein